MFDLDMSGGMHMWRRRGVGMSYSVAYPTAVERVKNKSYAVKEPMKTNVSC